MEASIIIVGLAACCSYIIVGLYRHLTSIQLQREKCIDQRDSDKAAREHEHAMHVLRCAHEEKMCHLGRGVV